MASPHARALNNLAHRNTRLASASGIAHRRNIGIARKRGVISICRSLGIISTKRGVKLMPAALGVGISKQAAL